MNYYISVQSGFLGTAITKYLRNEWVYSIPKGQSIEDLTNMFSFIKPYYFILLAAYGNHYYQNDFLEVVNANIIGTYNLL